MTLRMGVVADDVTGANDIGSMFAKWGYTVHVLMQDGAPQGEDPLAQGAEIVILDTNSRLDRPEVARAKVFAATQSLVAAGCRRFFNKTCSVFRGNIGAEFDAMLDALGADFAVVVLGFPKNGRTTVDGIHYVRGAPLAESEFRNDPVHPMRRSDLVGILQSQTRRGVRSINWQVVAAGAAALAAAIEAARSRGGYVILDVTDQAALRTIAEAVCDEPILCGSSALAEELPRVWGLPAAPEPAPVWLDDDAGRGVLVAAGSLMPQTRSQVTALTAAGAVTLELDSLALLGDGAERAIDAVAAAAAEHLGQGADVLIHASHGETHIAATRARGRALGWTGEETARRVSDGLAEAVGRTVGLAGVTRLAVAGGETAAAVCTRLGVRGMRVWQEIEPGLPSCVSLTVPPLLLVLKSGSFGSPGFLVDAVQYLRRAGG